MSPTEVQAVVPSLTRCSVPIVVTTKLDNGMNASSAPFPFTVDGYVLDEPDEFDPSFADPTFKAKDEHTLKTAIPSGLKAGPATIVVTYRAGSAQTGITVTG